MSSNYLAYVDGGYRLCQRCCNTDIGGWCFKTKEVNVVANCVHSPHKSRPVSERPIIALF